MPHVLRRVSSPAPRPCQGADRGRAVSHLHVHLRGGAEELELTEIEVEHVRGWVAGSKRAVGLDGRHVRAHLHPAGEHALEKVPLDDLFLHRVHAPQVGLPVVLPRQRLDLPVGARGGHEVEVQVVDPPLGLVEGALEVDLLLPVVQPHDRDGVGVMIEHEEHAAEEEHRVGQAQGIGTVPEPDRVEAPAVLVGEEPDAPRGKRELLGPAVVLAAEVGKHVEDVHGLRAERECGTVPDHEELVTLLEHAESLAQKEK